jgi:hypothetical protein
LDTPFTDKIPVEKLVKLKFNVLGETECWFVGFWIWELFVGGFLVTAETAEHMDDVLGYVRGNIIEL